MIHEEILKFLVVLLVRPKNVKINKISLSSEHFVLMVENLTFTSSEEVSGVVLYRNCSVKLSSGNDDKTSVMSVDKIWLQDYKLQR